MIHFIFPGQPVPASRPRVCRGHTFNEPKYADYKQALKQALWAEYGFYQWDFPNPQDEKAYAKFMNNNRYYLMCNVFSQYKRGDWDNFGKTVSDAIEQAGIILNDSQIVSGHVKKFLDKKNPRLEIFLFNIDPKEHKPWSNEDVNQIVNTSQHSPAMAKPKGLEA